ncbi:DUF433 domain-containing protein [Pannus brasiliensis CCIBt3594]|uniref:DUF433 domain-containing protein n=1 Tax=Pannus brasiliensis CCIBt3594 TaxID=1427578 RepID=A0AAW9QZL0_9CHRO
MARQPCIRNLRLTVRRVIELLATYEDRNELRQEFPELEDEDIRQALLFALETNFSKTVIRSDTITRKRE